MLYFFAPLFNPLPTAVVVVVAVAACVDRKCLIFKSVLHFVARLRVSFFLISFFVFVCVFAVFFGNNRLARFAFPFSLPCCFGVLVFGVWAFGFYFAWLSVICEIYANVSAVICVEDLF